MSGMQTRKSKQEQLDSSKYKRIITALAACGLTEKYQDEFLENEMDDEIVQSCVDNPQKFDCHLSSIIPKIGHKFRFMAEFEKTKGNDGETTSSSSSSQPAKNTPGRIQQPKAFINPFLRKIKMEEDYVPAKVKEEPRETENNNDGEPEVGNFMNQMAKLKRSQDPPQKVNMEVDDASVPAKVKAEPKETESNNERNPEVGNSKKSNPMAKPKVSHFV